jgi:hypothetical protein
MMEMEPASSAFNPAAKEASEARNKPAIRILRNFFIGYGELMIKNNHRSERLRGLESRL